MDEWGLSQCFLQPSTSTRVHLLPPLSHKCLLCLGHAHHMGLEWGLHLRAIHTQRLQLGFLLLPNQRIGLLVAANERPLPVHGCALFPFSLHPFHPREMKNPQTEIED